MIISYVFFLHFIFGRVVLEVLVLDSSFHFQEESMFLFLFWKLLIARSSSWSRSSTMDLDLWTGVIALC
jgi:hypothetical protein